MAAPATADDLLTLLDKSRLLESVDFESYLQHRRDSASIPERPEELAEVLVSDGLLTRFQANNLLQGKWMRYFIGPYKVLETLGAGSSGVVYLCEHERLRRRVAIKILQGEKARDPKSLERFNREARAAATLDHPNIVRAFDVGQEDRFHYLVMEYVDGQSLRQLVKDEGPLSATLGADYLRQAALGLKHAYEAGLVHRDIKPTNLMVDREGVVKILDLGLARFFEDEDDVLTQGAVLGSADYIAPEQAIDSHSVDIRADIYSLGATFWYCLSGSRPPRAGLDFIRRPSQQLISQPRTDVPEGLWQVLRKMMAPRPDDRYQTPSEVAEAIAPWAPDEATRLLLVETPPPEQTEDPAASQATIETVPDHDIAMVPAPVATTAPPPAVYSRRPAAEAGHFLRRPWLLAGILAGIAVVGGALAALAPGRAIVPGREPGSVPFFKPVSPHSP
jgi:eukaryotic-like serine/threonine-protein kinase